jgi:hypothetical protein
MPVRVGTKERWQIIHLTTEWQTMVTALKSGEFAVATEMYYVGVSKQEGRALHEARTVQPSAVSEPVRADGARNPSVENRRVLRGKTRGKNRAA